jgi:hypothetical protein
MSADRGEDGGCKGAVAATVQTSPWTSSAAPAIRARTVARIASLT